MGDEVNSSQGILNGVLSWNSPAVQLGANVPTGIGLKMPGSVNSTLGTGGIDGVGGAGITGGLPNYTTPAPGGFFDGLWNGFKNINWLDSKNTQGVTTQGAFMPMLSALQGFGNIAMANKANKNAEQQLAFSKQAFNKNFQANKEITLANRDARKNALLSADPRANVSYLDNIKLS